MKNFKIRYGGEDAQPEPTKHYWTEVGKKWRFIPINFLDPSDGERISLRVASLVSA